MIVEERIVTMIDNHIAEYYPQRKLIRCKDCKYWLKNQDYYEEGSRLFSALDTCQKLDGLNDATAIDYCSRAERKEE